MSPIQYNLSYTNGLSLLEIVIDDLTAKFRKLEKGKEFKNKQYKLEQTKNLISNLYEVYDSFFFLKKHAVWLEIEQEMNKLETKDNDISGFIIAIRTRLNGSKLALIDKYTRYENI